MEQCVWPTPTNVLWDLSVETQIEEAGYNPAGAEAQSVRVHARKSIAAAQRISKAGLRAGWESFEQWPLPKQASKKQEGKC